MRKESQDFLERYLDNALPSGSEIGDQKIWFDYIKPYIDSHVVGSEQDNQNGSNGVNFIEKQE